MVNHIEAINEDISNSQFYTFDLSANNDYPYILFKIENKNFYIDTNAKIKYNIIPSFDKNFNHSNMEMIYSNKQYITYKEFKTNIN